MRLVRDDMHDSRQLTRLLHEKALTPSSGMQTRIDPDLLLLAAPRSAVSTTITLEAISDTEQPIKILVTDIASAGLTGVSESPLPEDAAYTANLSTLFGQPHTQQARVVYCRPVLSQTYRISLAFEPPELPEPLENI